MDDLLRIYGKPLGGELAKYLNLRILKRLDGVGMNCGVEYTSIPFFAHLPKSTRYNHSLGVALIVNHFGGSKEAVLSGLFHDIATPCFAHSIDFLNGDYEKQVSTEDLTASLLKGSEELIGYLAEDNVNLNSIIDYSLYPLCDNPSPRLSADRLEYTLRNILYFGFADLKTISTMYQDLVVGENEFGEMEIMFNHLEEALRFGLLSLKTSEVYVSNEDRYAMEDLALTLKEALSEKLILSEDLIKTEKELINKLVSSERGKTIWGRYNSLKEVKEEKSPSAYQVKSKLRHINPYIQNRGRLSDLSNEFADLLQKFLLTDFSKPLTGVYSLL